MNFLGFAAPSLNSTFRISISLISLKLMNLMLKWVASLHAIERSSRFESLEGISFKFSVLRAQNMLGDFWMKSRSFRESLAVLLANVFKFKN